MTMLLMECGPGDSIQTLDGTRYIDDGLGRVEIASDHLREAMAAGWQIVDNNPPAPETISQALTRLGLTTEQIGGPEGIEAYDLQAPVAAPTFQDQAAAEVKPDEGPAAATTAEPAQRTRRQK